MGPLNGIKIMEVGGIGPGPFCGMLLADLGAEIVRVERKGQTPAIDPKFDLLHRGRRSIALDLKKPEAVQAFLRMIPRADALIEGFRPGVMEGFGLGPDACLERNPRLIYGRMTGWGQNGPLARSAGHDINFIGLSGALHFIGRANQTPPPPLNMVGDYGGGGMLLALGIVAALLEAQKSGTGQVLDAAVVDGSALLTTFFHGLRAWGTWTAGRQDNLLDGGTHFYDTYETRDGRFVAIGPLESKFYQLLLNRTGLSQDPDFGQQMERSKWPVCKKKMAALFKSKSRDEWCEILEGTDVCFAPVLTPEEAVRHPHLEARKTFIEIDGITQPAPAPRFSRTPAEVRNGPPDIGADTHDVLRDWGLSAEEIKSLKNADAI